MEKEVLVFRVLNCERVTVLVLVTSFLLYYRPLLLVLKF